MKVYFSWSGQRSRLMASILSNWLSRVIQSIQGWIADDRGSKDDLWTNQFRDKLNESQFSIFCVTPENYQDPWLLFEVGFLSRMMGDSKVHSLILGMGHDDLEGPIRLFDGTIFEKEDVYKLLETLNSKLDGAKLQDEILRDSFERFWPDLMIEVEKIANITIPGGSSEVMSTVRALAKYGLPEPRIGSYAFFSSGFESHALYRMITSVATKRLFLFGRKNRKLFDKEYRTFFSNLPEKIQNGFDFKLLFLDPDSPNAIISSAHQDEDFKSQLENCIANAYSVMEANGLDPSVHCRKYWSSRKHAIMVADDAILYTPIEYRSGQSIPLTSSNFNIINSTSLTGTELLEEFESIWNTASKF